MAKKRVVEAVATLVGCTIGAGILGIPYVIAKAGFLTGLMDIVIIGLLSLLINLYLGEVVLRTKGKHQLTRYAELYLGRRGKYLMFFSMVVGIYGALVAYLIGSGVALSSIFGLQPVFWSLVFFIVLASLIYFGIDAIGKTEAFILPAVLVIIGVIFLLGLGKVQPENLAVFDLSSIFVPYGLVLFAFIGTSAVPEMKEELENNKKALRKAILIGTLIPMVVYVMFTLAIVGVMGLQTHEIASVGIGEIIGEKLSFLGGVLATLTMSTSFLALGLALNELFRYDYGFARNYSWALSCMVPFLVFLLLQLAGLASFSLVIEVTGVITGVLTMIMVLVMLMQAKKRSGRVPEYQMYLSWPLVVLFSAMLVLGGFFMLKGVFV